MVVYEHLDGEQINKKKVEKEKKKKKKTLN